MWHLGLALIGALFPIVGAQRIELAPCIASIRSIVQAQPSTKASIDDSVYSLSAAIEPGSIAKFLDENHRIRHSVLRGQENYDRRFAHSLSILSMGTIFLSAALARFGPIGSHLDPNPLMHFSDFLRDSTVILTDPVALSIGLTYAATVVGLRRLMLPFYPKSYVQYLSLLNHLNRAHHNDDNLQDLSLEKRVYLRSDLLQSVLDPNNAVELHLDIDRSPALVSSDEFERQNRETTSPSLRSDSKWDSYYQVTVKHDFVATSRTLKLNFEIRPARGGRILGMQSQALIYDRGDSRAALAALQNDEADVYEMNPDSRLVIYRSPKEKKNLRVLRFERRNHAADHDFQVESLASLSSVPELKPLQVKTGIHVPSIVGRRVRLKENDSQNFDQMAAAGFTLFEFDPVVRIFGNSEYVEIRAEDYP